MATETIRRRETELPETAGEVVASLAQHRVLCTAQVRAIHFPDSRIRWTQSVLARLRDAGLVESVQPPRTGRRLWFATERGVRMAREAHALEATPRPLEGSEVAGQLQAHTLAVNDAGICFLRAARERDDEFGPLSWRHEVAHPLSRGRGRRRRTLIADAVLTYLRGEGGRVALEQRFLELDRATLSVDRLVAELAAYAELYRAAGGDGEPGWRAYYPRFPVVHCVLAGAPRPGPGAASQERDRTAAQQPTGRTHSRDADLDLPAGGLGGARPVRADLRRSRRSRQGGRLAWKGAAEEAEGGLKCPSRK
jgi:hypothetical protein